MGICYRIGRRSRLGSWSRSQRLAEIFRLLADNPFERGIKAVGRVESASGCDVADFQAAVGKESLSMPDTVHGQILQDGQTAGLTKQSHGRIRMHACCGRDIGDVDRPRIVTRNEDGHSFKFAELRRDPARGR